MSNSDYIEINNALNNYYGNKMNLYEEGSEYREEYRQKMKEQKKLVKELSIKAEAYDRVAEKLYARINHIIMTSHPAQCKPGYVDGLYNALDIISSELESGRSDD